MLLTRHDGSVWWSAPALIVLVALDGVSAKAGCASLMAMARDMLMKGDRRRGFPKQRAGRKGGALGIFAPPGLGSFPAGSGGFFGYSSVNPVLPNFPRPFSRPLSK
jgi:hypothetical protein